MHELQMEIATSYSSIKDHPKMTYLQVSTEQPTSAQLNSTNMANASGPWRLRFEIVNILDKESDMPPPLYLTNHGLNKVVTVDECGPRQEWYAIPVKGKKDCYIISPEPMAITPPGLARKAPGESVILAGEPDEWRLEFLPIHLNKENVDEIGNGDHYKIRHHELIGAILLLGKERSNKEVKIEAFIPGYVGPEPAWQFLKL